MVKKNRFWLLFSLILKRNYFILLMYHNISLFMLIFFQYEIVCFSVFLIFLNIQNESLYCLSVFCWHLWLHKNQLQANFKNSLDSHTEIQRRRKISSTIYILLFSLFSLASGMKHILLKLSNVKVSWVICLHPSRSLGGKALHAKKLSFCIASCAKKFMHNSSSFAQFSYSLWIPCLLSLDFIHIS